MLSLKVFMRQRKLDPIKLESNIKISLNQTKLISLKAQSMSSSPKYRLLHQQLLGWLTLRYNKRSIDMVLHSLVSLNINIIKKNHFNRSFFPLHKAILTLPIQEISNSLMPKPLDNETCRPRTWSILAKYTHIAGPNIWNPILKIDSMFQIGVLSK